MITSTLSVLAFLKLTWARATKIGTLAALVAGMGSSSVATAALARFTSLVSIHQRIPTTLPKVNGIVISVMLGDHQRSKQPEMAFSLHCGLVSMNRTRWLSIYLQKSGNTTKASKRERKASTKKSALPELTMKVLGEFSTRAGARSLTNPLTKKCSRRLH